MSRRYTYTETDQDYQSYELSPSDELSPAPYDQSSPDSYAFQPSPYGGDPGPSTWGSSYASGYSDQWATVESPVDTRAETSRRGRRRLDREIHRVESHQTDLTAALAASQEAAYTAQLTRYAQIFPGQTQSIRQLEGLDAGWVRENTQFQRQAQAYQRELTSYAGALRGLRSDAELDARGSRTSTYESARSAYQSALSAIRTRGQNYSIQRNAQLEPLYLSIRPATGYDSATDAFYQQQISDLRLRLQTALPAALGGYIQNTPASGQSAFGYGDQGDDIIFAFSPQSPTMRRDNHRPF